MTPDPFQSAMDAAMNNMHRADALAADGNHEMAAWLAQQTMSVAMSLATTEALFQGIHGGRMSREPRNEQEAWMAQQQSTGSNSGWCMQNAALLQKALAQQTHQARQPADLPERLLATGVMAGPHRRTRPLTVSKLQRLLRWLRATFQPWRSPR